MNASYLTLANGRDVRILFSMNVLEEFVTSTGKEVIDLNGIADIALLRKIAWLSAREGERANGKDLGLDEMEFGRLMSMSAITRFVIIFKDQITPSSQK
ncbi:MAG TPA: hypothetical protein PK727_04625 [Bacteroidales bacterium]|nr:hypothetical protein [Bacteroidales bacterium]